jgi:hypothetical protein
MKHVTVDGQEDAIKQFVLALLNRFDGLKSSVLSCG